jgi:inosine-uridine nucleoside N-ribohydrolase
MLKVIFDTDPGVDDALALLYLHKHAQIDLIGVTTTFGNASVESTTHNALYLKQAWGFAAPVARGAGGPLQPEATRKPGRCTSMATTAWATTRCRPNWTWPPTRAPPTS